MAKPNDKGSIPQYKAALRRAIRKNAVEPEINYLNITPMLDIMTIILVFLLKSLGESTASISQSDDLRLPKSVIKTEASNEGAIITISKTQILVGEAKVVQLPSSETLAQTGVGARYKSRGSQNLYIDPLGRQLKQIRKVDKIKLRQLNKNASTSHAIIVADETTPFRLLAEVLFTLGQEEFGKHHLMVMQSRGGG